MKGYWIGFVFVAHLAAGQPTDSTRLDSLPRKSALKYSLISEAGILQTITTFNNLQSFLEANQAGSPLTASYQFSLGIGFRLNRLKVMGQINSPLTFLLVGHSGASSTTWTARQQSGGQLGLLLGYDLLNAYNKRLFIYGGVGWMSINFNIYRKGTQTVPVQTIFQGSSTGGVGSFYLYRVPFFDAGLELATRERRRRGSLYVFRLGFRRGWKQEAWASDVYQFSNPLTDRFSQVYIQTLVNGATSWGKSKKP